jgi:hypothetical protein
VSDVFEEVNEAIARDKASAVWKKAAPFVIGGAVAIVASVAAWEFYQYQRSATIEKAADRFSEAAASLETADPASSRAALEEVAAGEGAAAGFAAVANSILAGLETSPGGDAAAAAAYLEKAVALETGALSDAALLKLAYLRSDSLTRAELEALVQPLVASGGAPSALAKELLASKSLAEGEIERARTEFQALTLELDAPQAMQQRVSQVLEVMPKAAAPAVDVQPAAGE